MSDHSPGPWMIEPREVTALLLSKDGTHLANIFANDSDIFQPESKWANARLIAAAPEMAGTITALRAEVDDLGNRLHHVHRLWANNEHALRAENERLKIENIQMQAALGYGILAEDERHILPSNPFKCGTCDASKRLRAENERLRAELHTASDMNAVYEGRLQEKEAENERIGKDYQTARDAHDKLLAENERFKISLSDTVQQTQDQVSEITALRAEVASRDDQFQQYARKMESDMNALAAQNERLRGVLAWFADEYDQMNFMRSADMHRAECRCLRCARDEARAALEEKP